MGYSYTFSRCAWRAPELGFVVYHSCTCKSLVYGLYMIWMICEIIFNKHSYIKLKILFYIQMSNIHFFYKHNVWKYNFKIWDIHIPFHVAHGELPNWVLWYIIYAHANIFLNLTNLVLTHWGRVTHICVGNLTIIGSDNGLSPGRHQAIIWTSAGILLIGPLGTNFSEILIEIITFSFKKMRLKVSSAKWRPCCFGDVGPSSNFLEELFCIAVTTDAKWLPR